jgi:DNA repair protein RadC
MLMLNSLYEPIAYNLVSMGGLTESIAHPRDILRVAVVCNAYAIILIHNHPSGRPFPSTSDAFATKRCAKAATTIGIRLLDHVIIGKAGTYTTSKKIKGQTERVRFASYFSLKEAGLI